MSFTRILRLLSSQNGSIFKRNFINIAKANMVGLTLPILAAPILTRLFSPDDFSTLATFSAVLALISSICTLRFDWVIPNKKYKAESGAIFLFGIVTLIIIIISLTVFIVLFGTNIAIDSKIIWLLPIAVLGSGIYSLLVGWQIRERDLSTYSKTTVTRSVVNVATSLFGGLINAGAIALVIAVVLSTWSGIIKLTLCSYQNLRNSLLSIKLKLITTYFMRNIGHALWSSMVSLLNAMSTNSTILILAFFYSSHEIGWYALMQRLVSAPIGTMTSALSNAFWSETSDLMRNKKPDLINSLYLKTTRKLIFLAVPVIVLCLLAPFYIGPIFGNEQWGKAAYVLMAMIPLFTGSILFSPTNHLVVFDQQKLQLLTDSVRLILVFTGIFITYSLDMDFIAAVFFASLGSFLGHFLLFIIHLRAHKNYVV